jgi:serine/threonine protein kinase
MMKVCIDDDYKQYASQIKAIFSGDYTSDEVYCNGRNRVERVTINGRPFVLKKFVKVTWINRIIYGFFRKTKAERSYLHAKRLAEHGFESPTPVAYADCKTFGIYRTSYYLSEYVPYPSLNNLYDAHRDHEMGEAEYEELQRAFINFTSSLHKARIVHKDYNPSNILVHREADGYHFMLIDINRMTFGRTPGIKTSMTVFDRFGLNIHNMGDILPQYASERNFDLEDCIMFAMLSRHKRKAEHRIKEALKRKILRISVQ